MDELHDRNARVQDAPDADALWRHLLEDAADRLEAVLRREAGVVRALLRHEVHGAVLRPRTLERASTKRAITVKRAPQFYDQTLCRSLHDL